MSRAETTARHLSEILHTPCNSCPIADHGASVSSITPVLLIASERGINIALTTDATSGSMQFV